MRRDSCGSSRVRRKEISIVKETTKENVADLGTKNLDEKRMTYFVEKLGFVFKEGRSVKAPKVTFG